jgi:4-aminobutyrate aminotransferase
MMIYAKGIANGMPLSGIVTRKEIMDAMPPGSLVSIALCGPD